MVDTSGAGVVVTVVRITVQHVALSQSPLEQTMSPLFLENPSGQVKLSQVGAGVVVTVGGGFSTQHVALSQEPAAQTIVARTCGTNNIFHPSGQVKSAHVGAGVVVTVVMITVQQDALLHSPVVQTMSPLFLEYPSGQVKLSQEGDGVVVTVVTMWWCTATRRGSFHQPSAGKRTREKGGCLHTG